MTMTGRKLIEKLLELDDEILDKAQVKFYNPKYEAYEVIDKLSVLEEMIRKNGEMVDTGRNFILLNEE